MLLAFLSFGSARADSEQHIWLHYDYMVAPDHCDAPSDAAIQMVVDVFAAHRIQLHVDPQHTAIPEIPRIYFQANAITFMCDRTTPTFAELKGQYFHPASDHDWHYAIFGYIDCGGSTGIAELPGNDFFVGLGADLEGLGSLPQSTLDLITASLIMHELGHNLDLHHGGADEVNYKPNYLSIMNYSFASGIPYSAAAGSVAIAGHRIDYSESELPPLDENRLDETVGIQAGTTDITWFSPSPQSPRVRAPASGPIDWNRDGDATDTDLQWDVDANWDLDYGFPWPTFEVLKGFDDWTEVHRYLSETMHHGRKQIVTEPPLRQR